MEGKPVNFASPEDVLDHGIATVYQDLALVPLMSVARNFFLGCEPKRKILNLFPVMDIAVAAKVSQERMAEMGIK